MLWLNHPQSIEFMRISFSLYTSHWSTAIFKHKFINLITVIFVTNYCFIAVCEHINTFYTHANVFYNCNLGKFKYSNTYGKTNYCLYNYLPFLSTTLFQHLWCDELKENATETCWAFLLGSRYLVKTISGIKVCDTPTRFTCLSLRPRLLTPLPILLNWWSLGQRFLNKTLLNVYNYDKIWYFL